MFITKKELKARIDEAVDKARKEERDIRWQEGMMRSLHDEMHNHLRDE